MLGTEEIFSFRTQSEWKRGNWKGNIDHQSGMERRRGFRQRAEDDGSSRRVCKGGLVEEGRVERGEPEQSANVLFKARDYCRLVVSSHFCPYWQDVSGGSQVFPLHAPSLLIKGAWCMQSCETIKEKVRHLLHVIRYVHRVHTVSCCRR